MVSEQELAVMEERAKAGLSVDTQKLFDHIRYQTGEIKSLQQANQDLVDAAGSATESPMVPENAEDGEN